MTLSPQDRVVKRFYAKGTWRLQTVAHFGGGDTWGSADMCLARDLKGLPVLTGASIAGAARDYLLQRLMTWQQYQNSAWGEPEIVEKLFGGRQDRGFMSALWVSDGVFKTKVEKAVSVRDGVAICGTTGVAADRAKFDLEVLEAGTEFELRFGLLLREGDEDRWEALTTHFRAILDAFSTGEILLGARTQRGYGRGSVGEWQVYELDMRNPDHVLAWLRGKVFEAPPSDSQPRSTWLGPVPDLRSFFAIDLKCCLRTSLLVRSPSAQPDAPNAVHLSSGIEPVPVIPGTSAAGKLRQHAEKILHSNGWKGSAIKKGIAAVFGPMHEEETGVSGTALWSSRLHVGEHSLSAVDSYSQQRVAIDRFTGGSLEHALFEERPVRPHHPPEQDAYHVRLKLQLAHPEDWMIGLLLLLMKDLWNGLLPLGGEAAMGRGVLAGKRASLRFNSGHGPAYDEHWSLEAVAGKMQITKGDGERLEHYVKSLSRQPGQGVEMFEKIDERVLQKQLAQVADKGRNAWLFIQTSNFIGFGVVDANSVHWPPGVQPDWSRLEDLRFFGNKAEWHVWRTWGQGWQGRLLGFEENDQYEDIQEFHYLWGDSVETARRGKEDTRTEPSWKAIFETRGPRFQLPVDITEEDLPLRLKLRHKVAKDETTGLAGIVDTALVGLYSRSDDSPLKPSTGAVS